MSETAIDLTEEDKSDTVYVAKPGDEGTRKRVAALAEGLKDVRVADGAKQGAKTTLRKRLRTLNGVAPAPGSAAHGADAAAVTKPTPSGAATPAAAPPTPAAASAAAPMAPAAPLAAAQKAPASATAAAAQAPPSPAAAKPSTAPPAPAPGAPAPSVQPATNSNKMLAQLHAERLARMSEEHRAALHSPGKAAPPKPGERGGGAPVRATDAIASSSAGASSISQRPRNNGEPSIFEAPRPISILSYNLWFNEACELVQRMRAIGDTIEREGYPDLLLFQEVTQNMVLIFRQSAWFRRYHCSTVPEDKSYFTLLLARRDTTTLPAMQPWMEQDYTNSCMGRSILYTRVSVGGRALVVGTTHLESPIGPGPQQMVAQRQEQLGIAIKELEAAAGPSCDILLAGDMNWNDERDGPMRLLPRWCDAWPALHPSQPGFTWDPKANPMLSTARYKGSRLDRVLCRLNGSASAQDAAGPSSSASCTTGGRNAVGWRLGEMKLVGTTALPGLTHEYRGKRLPVLPSDHFGLLVKLLPAGTLHGAPGTGRVLGGGAPAAQAGPSSQPAHSAAPDGGAARGDPAAAGSSALPKAPKARGGEAPSTGQPEVQRTSLRRRQQLAATQAQAQVQRPVPQVDLSADADDDVIVL